MRSNLILSYEDDNGLKERINFELEIPIDLYEPPYTKNEIIIILSNKDNYIFDYTGKCVFEFKNIKSKEKEKEKEKEIKKKSSHTLEETFIITGIALFLFLIIILILFLRRIKKKKSEENQLSENELTNGLNPIELN